MRPDGVVWDLRDFGELVSITITPSASRRTIELQRARRIIGTVGEQRVWRTKTRTHAIQTSALDDLHQYLCPRGTSRRCFAVSFFYRYESTHWHSAAPVSLCACQSVFIFKGRDRDRLSQDIFSLNVVNRIFACCFRSMLYLVICIQRMSCNIFLFQLISA